MQCEICGHEVRRGIIFDGKATCRDCLIRLSKLRQACPVCGQVISPEHSVSLPNVNTLSGKPANIVICPNCHALFFDEFNYKMLNAKPVMQ